MEKRIGTCVFYGCKNFTYGWPHHRKQRSAGGSDRDENLVDICFDHHNWVHEHIEKAHELGLIIFEHEPEPTEKLLQVRFREVEKPARPHSPQAEADMESALFDTHLQEQEQNDD